ncbi:MAG: hypothetical protein RJA76_193 [Bacteroidota bacterium]
MNKKIWGFILSSLIFYLFSNSKQSIPEKLSDYQFFKGEIKHLVPNEGVIPYDLNSTLFSDYASKIRFMVIPKGKKIPYNDESVLDFPEGSILIKNFYYPINETNPELGRKIIETRLLIHESTGWKAYPYVWNEEQTDAILEITGASIPVKFKNQTNHLIDFTYEVPNINQCKGCHEVNGKMSPIGPSARQLNKLYSSNYSTKNQVTELKEKGLLDISNEELKEIPQMANYLNQNESLDKRAKAYLDINCAHCHNPSGPAKNSGLNLSWNNKDLTSYGYFKSPVAAGRGSGHLLYDIQPGKAKQSILHYRMNSNDPGIMMPELGRKLIHKEGVELIKEWINKM